MVQELADRIAGSERFGPVFVAGPAAVYRGIDPRLEVIDTDGSLGDNVRASLDHIASSLQGRPVGFLTCDVLPDSAALRRLADLHRSHVPCDLWFPIVRAPEDPGRLGASAWKPKYRVVPKAGEEAVGILPGHLAIGDPGAFRVGFLCKLLGIGYRTRNRSIPYRTVVMVRDILVHLLGEDLRNLARLRAPVLTVGVLRAGLSTARRLHKGTVTQRDLEDALRIIFMKTAHRRTYPERRVRMPIVDELSLALDIDTVEEAREHGGDVAESNTGP